MKSLLDWFKLGLSIGQEAREDYDLLEKLLDLERPCPEAQFVIIGALVGHSRFVEDPWPILEKLEEGDDPGVAIVTHRIATTGPGGGWV